MIPATAHFIWFGPSLPWIHALSIRSAALRGGFERVILHHGDPLEHTAVWPELEALPGFEARRIDAAAVLGASGPHADALGRVYAKLDAPAARANVLRAALLAGEGGVYLDLDTITLAPLDELRRSHSGFCGDERVIWPAAVRRDGRVATRATNLVRAGARELCRQLPDGWRRFRKLEGHYPRAANNAVLAATAGHAFIARMLANMVAVPPSRQLVRFALGTHLLQDTLAEVQRDPPADPSERLSVLPPRYFYPLGPEISHHWFRLRSRQRELPRLDAVLDRDTLVVHWYASVRTKKLVPRVDAAYVRAHADRQLFSALALPLLDR